MRQKRWFMVKYLLHLVFMASNDAEVNGAVSLLNGRCCAGFSPLSSTGWPARFGEGHDC
jgi:hypothetical protein